MTLEELQILITAETKGLKEEIDNVKKQIGGMNTEVKSSTAGITKAFGMLKTALVALGIGKFVKDSIDAASNLQGAMLGLQSILAGQGQDFTKANTFIQSYIKDGLIPLTDAVTAYKNLASRGYSDEQIQNVLSRLKDSAAFGRQASLSMGQAVKSASEGLKNENSILVDNAGVTKNVAQMWDDYAKKVGKSRNDLTQHEKIQAEVNGIMQGTRFQVGDAAKYTETYAGKVAALGKIFNDIKVNIGNAFMPILNIALPVLQILLNAIATVTGYVAQFMQALFGTNKQQVNNANTANMAANAQLNLGNATKKAGDKAKRGVAGFDEINQLQEDIAKNADAAADSMGGATPTTPAMPSMPTISTPEIPQWIQDFANDVKEYFAPVKPVLDEVGAAFSDLGSAFGELGNAFMQNPIVQESLKSLGDMLRNGIIGNLYQLSGAIEVVTGVARILASLFNGDFSESFHGFENVVSGTWDVVTGIMYPFFPEIAQKMQTFKDDFSKKWESLKGDIQKYGDPAKLEASDFGDYIRDKVSEKWTDLKTATANKWGEIKLGINNEWEMIKQITWDDVNNTLVGYWESLKSDSITKWDTFKNMLSEKWNNIKEQIGWADVKNSLLTHWGNLETESGKKWDSFKVTLGGKWDNILTQIGWDDVKTTVLRYWKSLNDDSGTEFDNLKSTLSQKWEEIRGSDWGTVKDTILGIWGQLKTESETIFGELGKSIKNIIKTPVNAVIDAINKVIDGINKIRVTVPDIPGIIKGFSLGFNLDPFPPMLARGGIVDSPTLAMIGEAGKEAVVPLENTSFVNTLASAVGSAVMASMQFSGSSSQNTGAYGNQEIVIQIDGTKMARVMIPGFNKEVQRMGYKTILQTV